VPPSAAVPATNIPSTLAVIPNATIRGFIIRSFLCDELLLCFADYVSGAEFNNRQQQEPRLSQSIGKT
jgi:hypothetical protein